MSKNPTDRMKDPFYAQLLFHIESMICRTDELAKEAGITLTDSQVRSTLIKAKQIVDGADFNMPETNERENILSNLAMNIWHAPDEIMMETTDCEGKPQSEPLDLALWSNALETVADSIKTRKSNVPGSRCYLDYVQDFIADSQKRE